MFRTTGRLTSPSWQTICSTVSPSGVDASSWVLGTSAQEGGDRGWGGWGGAFPCPPPPLGRLTRGAHQCDPTPGRGGRVGQGTLRAGAGGHPTRTANPPRWGRGG